MASEAVIRTREHERERCQQCSRESRCPRLLAGETPDETFCTNSIRRMGDVTPPRRFVSIQPGMLVPY